MRLCKQLNLRIDQEQMRGVRKLAEARYSSPSQVIREAIAHYLRRPLTDDQRTEGLDPPARSSSSSPEAGGES